MLATFKFGNYLSFKDENGFSMIPESLKEGEQYLHRGISYDNNLQLLKSIGIYGHNSHGKTNLLKALDFFQRFTLTSADRKPNDIIDIQYFSLNTENFDQPSFFEAVFYIKDYKYRYGFKITSKSVVEEWLFYAQPRVRENYLFVRAGQEYKLNKTWEKTGGTALDKSIHYTGRQELLLSSLILTENRPPHVEAIRYWLKNLMLVSDIGEEKYFKQALLILSNERYRPLVNKLISAADLGFTTVIDKIDSLLSNKLLLGEDLLNLWFREELNEFSLYSRHDVFNESHKIVDTVRFELLKKESSGTIKFLTLACMLSYAIMNGFLVFIDEIDSKFHSLLLLVLIEFFHNSRINYSGSQLIFTTHNTILLNKYIRRDQIMLIDKNEFGESSIRRAHNAENPIRTDTSLEKEYRKGKFGGISKKLKRDNNQSTLDFGLKE